MAKTTPTTVEVQRFLDAVEHPTRRADGLTLYEMMDRVSGLEARMWGPTIVGFGSYNYTYESGRSGTSLRVGFSPRKAKLVVYIMPGFDTYDELLQRLGKHKTGSSCLYINKLADVDMAVLEELVRRSLDAMAERYPT